MGKRPKSMRRRRSALDTSHRSWWSTWSVAWNDEGSPWVIPRYPKKWCMYDISTYSMSNTNIMLIYDKWHIPCYGNPGWIVIGTAGISAETLHKVIAVILSLCFEISLVSLMFSVQNIWRCWSINDRRIPSQSTKTSHRLDDVAWCVYVWLSCWWPQVSSSTGFATGSSVPRSPAIHRSFERPVQPLGDTPRWEQHGTAVATKLWALKDGTMIFQYFFMYLYVSSKVPFYRGTTTCGAPGASSGSRRILAVHQLLLDQGTLLKPCPNAVWNFFPDIYTRKRWKRHGSE